MSILLESLSQQNASNESEVPDLSDNHFDDELLGDEWLIKRVKIWRVIAIALFVLLIASWLFFYQQMNSVPRSQNSSNQILAHFANQDSASATERVESKTTNNQSSSSQRKPADSPVLTEQTELTVAQQNVTEKKVYKPQKRENTQSKTINSAQASTTGNSGSIQKKESAPASQTVAETSLGATLSVQELSEDLRNQFPNIEINSFVVAEDPEDSFVILDGSFYKMNQVIAPNLILREIGKDAIVVEFKGQKVSLPNK